MTNKPIIHFILSSEGEALQDLVLQQRSKGPRMDQMKGLSQDVLGNGWDLTVDLFALSRRKVHWGSSSQALGNI